MTRSDEAVREFQDLAVKYKPHESFAAAMYVQAMVCCFQAETITEAVDASRVMTPHLENLIRRLFPTIMDVKLKKRKAHR
jgi:hypothetical protein